MLEQAVHERCLAVVHVRDDGDVSNVLHIVNDRLTHAANIPAAPDRREREKRRNCQRVLWRFAAEGQAPRLIKFGNRRNTMGANQIQIDRAGEN